MKGLNSLGQTLREQHANWQNMNQNKPDVEQFAYNLTLLDKMIGMSDEGVSIYY